MTFNVLESHSRSSSQGHLSYFIFEENVLYFVVSQYTYAKLWTHYQSQLAANRNGTCQKTSLQSVVEPGSSRTQPLTNLLLLYYTILLLLLLLQYKGGSRL